MSIQQQGSPQNQWLFCGTRKKEQCTDFDSHQKQRVYFGGNNTDFGGNLFLECIPPTFPYPKNYIGTYD